MSHKLLFSLVCRTLSTRQRNTRAGRDRAYGWNQTKRSYRLVAVLREQVLQNIRVGVWQPRVEDSADSAECSLHALTDGGLALCRLRRLLLLKVYWVVRHPVLLRPLGNLGLQAQIWPQNHRVFQLYASQRTGLAACKGNTRSYCEH